MNNKSLLRDPEIRKIRNEIHELNVKFSLIKDKLNVKFSLMKIIYNIKYI